MKFFSLIISFYILFTLIACGQEKVCDPKDKECYTKKGYPACRSRIDLDKYYEFLNTDKNSVSKEIVADTERCIYLKEGEKVVIQYSDANKMKIYFRNLEKSYWVSKEALYGPSN